MMNSQIDEIKEIQDNEIEALKAIFMEDYRPVIQKSAWKVTPTAPEFILDLYPLGTEKDQAHCAVSLYVKFPKTYPNKIPELRIELSRGLTPIIVHQLSDSLRHVAEGLKGSEMIYDLADHVRNFLVDHNTPPPEGSKLSFHEQMVKRMENNLKAEKERELEEEARRAQKAEAELREQSEMINSKIRQEMERKRENARAARQNQQEFGYTSTESINDDFHAPFQADDTEAYSTADASGSHVIVFDNIITIPIEDVPDAHAHIPKRIRFQAVTLGPCIGKGAAGETFLAQPIGFKVIGDANTLEEAENLSLPSLLAIKRVHITGSYYMTQAGKRKLQDIERELDRLRSMQHPHILSTLDAKLERKRDTNSWMLYVLIEHEQGGSLSDLLQKCGGGLRLAIARKYIKQLLWAVNHIHLNGFVCKDISSSNVFCSANQSVKLAGISYAKRLDDLNKSNPLTSTSFESEFTHGRAKSWVSPELQDRPGVYGRKNDIWCLGVTFLEMLWGVDLTREFGDFGAFVRSVSEVSEATHMFARKMLEPDPKKRYTAIDLLNDSFFATDTPNMPIVSSSTVFVDGVPPPTHPAKAHMATPAVQVDFDSMASNNYKPTMHRAPSLQPAEHSHTAVGRGGNSRYKTDFEEIEFLGKGGFGEVVKARNRLDSRLYAVKKIKLDPRDSEDLRKILREVQTLSSLHHQYVVRYYATWFEDEDGSSWKDNGEDSLLDDDSDSSFEDEDDDDDEDVSVLKKKYDFLSMSHTKSRSYSAVRFDEDEEEDGGGGYGHHDDFYTESDTGEERQTVDTGESSNDFISFAHDGEHDNAAATADSSEHHPPPSRDLQLARNVMKKFHRGSDKSSESKKIAHQRSRVLYIQMEYCEKRTLRDVIDDGIDEQEAWRLFRQVLEGLVHLHSQGMIHRDLKPSNVFLDSNNDVKIGDFGLATTNQSLVDAVNAFVRTSSFHQKLMDAGNVPASSTTGSFAGYSSAGTSQIAGENMTTGVGTTFYVSPEVLPDPTTGTTSGMRYNQKVDMFSLGVIFFEMCYQLSTGMQRAIVLNELRGGKFPDDFPKDYVNQRKIIGMLLSSQPKDRPNSFELLRSDLLPPKLEDEYIKECVRTIANPNTPYYNKLMSAMFSQSSDRHKDFTYDYQTQVDTAFDPFSHIFYDRIRDQMAKVFRRHGAIDVSVPLLIPKNDLYEWNWRHPVYLMDSQGSLNQLPFDQTVPFARYISRKKGIQQLKRFTFDKVYRENPTGGQPEAVLEADFDIIHRATALMVPDAEVLKVVEEVLEELPPYKAGGFYFLLNNAGIVDLILDSCHVPADYRKGVMVALSSLSRGTSFSAIRNVLKLKFRLQRSVLDELSIFNVQGDLETVGRNVESMLSGSYKARFREFVGELRILLSVAKNIGIRHKIVFYPLLVYNNHFYKNGMVFEAVADTLDSKKKDILAIGGRYDILMQHFAHPNDSTSRELRGVGVNIAVQKLIRHLDMHQSEQVKYLIKAKNDKARSFGIWAPKRSDVYVASFGKTLLQERLEVARDLWSYGIRTEFQYDDMDPLTPEDLITYCKKSSINWIVIVKHKSADIKMSNPSAENAIMVKVKDVLRKTETEVGKSELPMWLTNEIAEQTRVDHSQALTKFRSKHDLKAKESAESARGEYYAQDLLKGEGLEMKKYDFDVQVVYKEARTYAEGRGKERSKMKQKRKNVLVDKAIHRISPVMDDLTQGEAQVIAFDLPKETVKRMSEIAFWHDEGFKKLVDMVGMGQRETLERVRGAVQKLMEAKHRCVWLYSHKDDFALLCCL